MVGVVKQLLVIILNNLFYENIRGFISLVKLMKKSATDAEVNKLIDTYKLDYLEGGWEILISINRTCWLLANIVGWIFISKDSPLYFRVTTIWPITYAAFVVFDKISQRFKGAQEIWMIFMIIFLSILVLNTTFKSEKYLFNEMWITFISLSQFWSMFMCLTWKKLIIVFWITMSCLLIISTTKYENTPIVLYVAILTHSIMFPVATMFYWIKIKETILLVKTNKDLIHTIRMILQVFPEGVVIRSLDSNTKQTITTFANDVAKNILNFDVQKKLILDTFDVHTVWSNEESFNQDLLEQFNLSDFLNQQETKLENNKISIKSIEQLVELRNNLCDVEDNEEKTDESIVKSPYYFNIKTIKVIWENNQESYLHVFIDTSQIKKLEEERANNKCQQLMFASVSHELRTPLNAFINSLQLIGITTADMKKLISLFPDVAAKVEHLYPKFEKFFKVGEISSKLLLVLVEDVLDMVKFSTNTFALNLERFYLKDLLTEIYSIFAFQCEEKHLKFYIEWEPREELILFRSDQK